MITHKSAIKKQATGLLNFGVRPACVVGTAAPYNHVVLLAGGRIAAFLIRRLVCALHIKAS
jgi:hypothetical protein